MIKRISIILVFCMLSVTVLSAIVFADETETTDQMDPDTVQVQDDLVTTSHTAIINGEELAYTVTAGTMVLNTGGEQCEFFLRAYIKDGVDDVGNRPITFAFNGGPGSCSYYLEMGCLGPRRPEMTDEGNTVSLPPEIVDNENSLLDITDLVFIDAIGTGYSRPVDESKLSEFVGYDNDIRSFGDFIYQYLNRYGRWSSEKYIAGESYGTVRAVGLCKYLADTYAVNLNGLILISSLNDFSTAIPNAGNEKSYGLYFPTFAADAWYHEMLDEKYQEMKLEDYLEEVCEFVSSEYLPSLFQGNRLSEEEHNELAEKISSYLGLPVDYVIEKNLRITLDDFCSKLLADKNLLVGRDDGRYAGPINGLIEEGGSDPSSIESDLLIGNVFYEYLTNELEYQTDLPYVPLNDEVGNLWTSPDLGTGWIGGYFSQEDIVYECMSNNPYLKIWVICGYFDAATPFYAAEWTYAHVFLNDESKDNLSFTHYPSGHMFYLEKDSYDQFRKDAENWYAK